MSDKTNSFDLDKVKFHPQFEKIVDYLCKYCENNNPSFFRIMTTYWITKIASEMRASIRLHNQNVIPLNAYAIALAPSGAGKTKSMNFFEDNICHLFYERFKGETIPAALEKNASKIAVERSIENKTDPNDEKKIIKSEFKELGEWLFSFDDSNVPALKQFRTKLLISGIGALNFEVDEIGDNIENNDSSLSKYLELFDKGYVKESLRKNTKESKRTIQIKGSTPANLIMFGTSSSLLNGGKKEENFNTALEKGYGRRCFFSFSKKVNRQSDLTPEEIYEQGISVDSVEFIEDFADHLIGVADPINYNKILTMSRETEILHIDYKLYCQRKADKLDQHRELERTELEHRHFKALKLAGAYAFIEGSDQIQEKHLYYAYAIAEESGEAYQQLVKRDGPYVKLAKYLGTKEQPITQVELVQDLPFYRGSASQKQELLTMAIAWGYQNHILIKKFYTDGIEFLRGESLKKTNMDELTVSYSDHQAYRYYNDTITWDNLAKLVTQENMHWVSHHVDEGHRHEDKVIPGFNLITLDCDGTVPMNVAKELFADFKYIMHTTKRHTEEENRFRIILPMEYVLKLDNDDFIEFMQGVFSWLPFELDDQVGQRSRKWLTNPNAEVYVNDGKLFNPLDFIPKTIKNEKRKTKLVDQQSLNNLERWFLNNTGSGNRSNQLIRFALILVDAGKSMTEIEEAVYQFNDRLESPLSEKELLSTVLVTARKRYNKQAA